MIGVRFTTYKPLFSSTLQLNARTDAALLLALITLDLDGTG